MSKTNQIRLLVGALVLIGFISLGAILTNMLESEVQSLQRGFRGRMDDVTNRLQLIAVVGMMLVYAAAGLALGIVSPYTRSELFRGTITVLVPLCILSLLTNPAGLLTLLILIGAGMGIIYGIGQFWAQKPETDFPIYLGLIQEEDGSLAQVQWMRESGRVMLNSTKTGQTKMLTVRGSLQEAQAFFQQLRSKNRSTT